MTPAQPLIPFYTQRPSASGAAASAGTPAAAKEGTSREVASDELVTAIWQTPSIAPMSPIKRSARGSSPDLRRR
jgi:hypothetical protein